MTGWLTAAAMARETWLIVGLLTGVVGCFVAMRGHVARWQQVADYWLARAVKAEDDGARQFFRPMGAPSVSRDVERQREWREQRALRGLDHHRRHSVDCTNDSEAATEIMQFCIGGLEVEGE